MSSCHSPKQIKNSITQYLLLTSKNVEIRKYPMTSSIVALYRVPKHKFKSQNESVSINSIQCLETSEQVNAIQYGF